MATLDLAAAVIPVEISVYALDNSSYVLLAHMAGIQIVKPPRLLSIVDGTDLLIRQADSYTVRFEMENFVPERTHCWLDGAASSGQIISKSDEDFRTYSCSFSLQ